MVLWVLNLLKIKKISDILILIGIKAAVLIAAFIPIPPADLWWQLTVGRYITQTGDVLRQNIFSYTASNFPILDHEWFCELIFFKIYNLGGLTALYILKAIILTLVFFIFYFLCRRRGVSPIVSGIAVVISVFLSNLSLFGDIRPYLFTYIFLAILLYSLYSYSYNNSSKIIYFLPIVFLIWLNCHGGYMLFPALIIIYMFSFFIKLILDNIKRKVGINGIKVREIFVVFWKQNYKLIFILTVSIFLILVNPYGLKLLLYPFSFSADTFYKSNLIEWVKPDLLGADLKFLIYWCLFVPLVILFRRKLSVFDIFLFLAFSYLVFSAVRHITLFSMTLSSVLAVCLFHLHALIRLKFRLKILNSQTSNLIACFVLFIVFFITAIIKVNSFSINTLSMGRTHFPYNGIKFIELNKLPGKLYHPYAWGGYLLWNLYPQNKDFYRVFIDGRANVAYPEDVFKKSIVLDFGMEGWEKLMDDYDINVALCSKYHMKNMYKDKNLVTRLIDSGKWALVYEDRAEFVFIKKSEKNQQLIDLSLEGKLIYPESSFRNSLIASSFISQGRDSEAMELLNKTDDYDNTDPLPYYLMADIFLRKNDFNSAKIMLDESLRRDKNFVQSLELMKRYNEAVSKK